MYENETYEGILERVLNRIPPEYDNRESSFLYNASAPIAVELQNMYIALDNILRITYFDTSDRDGKLQRCKERGIDITQFNATPSIVIIETTPTTLEIPIGSRFNHDSVNFVVTEKLTNGAYYAECESAGSVGNVTGDVTPINYIDGLASAKIAGVNRWGEDESSEEEISKIYYSSINSNSFGGNRADYIDKMKKISGVGGVKVYSASEWQGGGTVKIVFTTSEYTKPVDGLVESIQTTIDPVQNHGAGYGLAPIGHTVTVAGVTETSVNVSMSVSLKSGYTWQSIFDDVVSEIQKYLDELNHNWENLSNIVVRTSQIESRVLNVSGVLDVSNIKINNSSSNLSVDKDSIVLRGTISNAN